MKEDAMETTRLSEKGQIVIPKRIRADHNWEPGLEFSVEDLGDSIALKPIKSFRRTKLRDVLGCVHYKGPGKSIEEMDDAIAKGASEKA
jgi:AbrB family looped-hinge helix DNA binding protein